MKIFFNWFVRWMIWLYLVASELSDMAPDAAARNSLWCALGTTALVVPVVMSLFALHDATVIVALLVGVGMYLFFGLAAFFTEPRTNAPIHWTQNGGW